MRKPSPVTVARIIVSGFAIGAAAISFLHIVHVGYTYGLGLQAWAAPFFIDGFAVLGKLGRSRAFAPKTRKAGLWIMTVAGLLSLAANILAGETSGQRVFGALVVAGFVTAEWYASKLEAAPAPVEAKQGKRCEDGCTCRKHSKAKELTPVEKRKATIARKAAQRELADMRGGYVPADAPVSPAIA